MTGGDDPQGELTEAQRREMDEASQSIRRMVDEHGWAAVAVDGEPPFTYTAGLWRLADHPELIVTGMPEAPAKWVIDRAVQAVLAGRRIEAGTTIPGLLGDYAAAARQVEHAHLGELAFAADLHGGIVFTALQIVWPDRGGKFPWDRGASSDYRSAQPLLFTPPRSGGFFRR